MRPRGGRLIVGEASPSLGHAMVCHCLVVETEAHGVVLIDSGFGLDDVRDFQGRYGRIFNLLARPELHEEMTALRQLEALGYDRADVRHVIVTHMDLDHAGGIADFPDATVHVYREELDAAMRPANIHERTRYKPCQWAHGPNWQPYDDQGEAWFGFDAVRDLEGLPPEILLVPLTGHSRGHAAVAVDTGGEWLLHCGDAYFHRDEVLPSGGACPAGLKWFQSLVQADGGARLANQERLRQLVAEHGQEVRTFSAHDAIEWERLRGTG